MDSTQRQAGREAGPAGPGPARLPDERILEIVGEGLAEFSGHEWTVRPGPLLKGPGTVGVRIASADADDFRHVDLEFLLNVANPERTGLVDCTSGLAAEPEAAIRQAVGAWLDTTASVALEVLEQNGRYAQRFGPDEAEGFPGWHTIVGGVCGWGFGEDARSKQDWFAGTRPWTALAPVLAAGLDRRYLNGIRIFVGQGGRFQSCEVRVNGRLNGPATAALAGMDWPRTEKMSTARVYLLLVHQEESADEA